MYLEISGTPHPYEGATIDAEIEVLGEALKEKLGLKGLQLGFKYMPFGDGKKYCQRYYLLNEESDVMIIYFSISSVTTFHPKQDHQIYHLHTHNIFRLKCRLWFRKLLYKIGIL